MNLLETLSAPSFEYKKDITTIDFQHSENTVRCIWKEEDRVLLKFQYDIKENRFKENSGVIGDIIERDSGSEIEKYQRVLEALNIGMWRK